jgi:hypothetical protein
MTQKQIAAAERRGRAKARMLLGVRKSLTAIIRHARKLESDLSVHTELVEVTGNELRADGEFLIRLQQ